MTTPATDQSTLPPGASLRGWLDHAEREGRLAVAKPGADLRFGVAGIANRLDGTATSFFPRPSGHDVPVVSGLLSQRAWMAEAIGVGESELISAFSRATANPVPSVEVSDAPCQEVVEPEVDLERTLPIPTHNEHDSGSYITAGLLIARQRSTGRQNVSIHRLQVSSPTTLGALILPRHTMAFFAEGEAQGDDLDVAIVIGVDPLTLMSSQAIVELGQDELEISGALRGAPLEVTRCTTNDVRVPADAEIVIEGRLVAHRREPEGPFGEFPQYYGERAERHVIEVDAITHRKDPIFHTIVGGAREHLLLGGIPREASFLAHLRRSFSCVKDLHLAMGGVCRYHLYVQVDSPQPGEVTNVILGAMATHYDIKHVTVVDADVDVHDPQEVEWAVATRFQADRDLVRVDASQGSKLDPSTDGGVGSKLGFDATVPPGSPEMTYLRIRVPGEDDVDLDQVLQQAGTGWREQKGSES
ncbi:3-polyprenyl-4-hydroxybenzoate carboxy-lyase [Actinomycetales bacterium JB111]|nr:3-polyprenyl-4-hydroxybenzoate carboxy-lyase [Actinomycetales bacterium JB111]